MNEAFFVQMLVGKVTVGRSLSNVPLGSSLLSPYEALFWLEHVGHAVLEMNMARETHTGCRRDLWASNH